MAETPTTPEAENKTAPQTPAPENEAPKGDAAAATAPPAEAPKQEQASGNAAASTNATAHAETPGKTEPAAYSTDTDEKGHGAHASGHGETKKGGLGGKLKAIPAALKGGIGNFKAALLAIPKMPGVVWQAFVKGDLITKLLTLGFLVSLVLVVITGIQLFEQFIKPYLKNREKVEVASKLDQHLGEEAENALDPDSVVFLEKFKASIQSKDGSIRVVEFELFAEADTPDTSALIKGRLEEIRDVVTDVIQGQSYEVLMTDNGKKQLKQKVIEAISRRLKKLESTGSVKKVVFSHFVMS